MDFLVRNSQTLNAWCAGALSWWRIHLSGHSSCLFLLADSRISASRGSTHSVFRILRFSDSYFTIIIQLHKHYTFRRVLLSGMWRRVLLESQPTFRRNISPSSSGLNSKPSKKVSWSKKQTCFSGLNGIPEGIILHNHRWENPESCIMES
jgi:hypothetical protein